MAAKVKGYQSDIAAGRPGAQQAMEDFITHQTEAMSRTPEQTSTCRTWYESYESLQSQRTIEKDEA